MDCVREDYGRLPPVAQMRSRVWSDRGKEGDGVRSEWGGSGEGIGRESSRVGE